MLADPCCGSGTIPIEAALIGRNIAPGLNRTFAAQDWEAIKPELWKEERKKLWKPSNGIKSLKYMPAI
ncbi:MAG: hypothetical protein ACLTK0_06295 [Anaerovoracaceae bacterium]